MAKQIVGHWESVPGRWTHWLVVGLWPLPVSVRPSARRERGGPTRTAQVLAGLYGAGMGQFEAVCAGASGCWRRRKEMVYRALFNKLEIPASVTVYATVTYRSGWLGLGGTGLGFGYIREHWPLPGRGGGGERRGDMLEMSVSFKVLKAWSAILNSWTEGCERTVACYWADWSCGGEESFDWIDLYFAWTQSLPNVGLILLNFWCF